MSSIVIDKEQVPITAPPRDVFVQFAKLVHMRLPGIQELPQEKRYIGQLPAGYLLTRRAEDPTFTEPMSQAALQNLHDLGVRDIELHPENGTALVRKSEHTDCSLGRASWITQSTVESGRAFIAALNWILHRTFRLNDQEVLVWMQSADRLKEAQAVLSKEKGENESMLFATGRVIGSLLRRQMGVDTTEMRSMIELASGMGLADMLVDLEKNEIRFRGFNEMSAISAALLHGMNWQQLQDVREQVRNFASQNAQGGGVGSGPVSYSPGSIKRRRRN